MSKEIERLKSRIRFNKALINIYDNMNFVSKSNRYDYKIEEFQNELSELYKRIQELKRRKSMLKKLFISQPMRGLTDEEILKAREEIKNRAEKTIGEPLELINSFIEDYPGENNQSIPVWYLGKSIQFLSQADIAYFAGDWINARGCKIEYEIANAYGIKVIKEEKD